MQLFLLLGDHKTCHFLATNWLFLLGLIWCRRSENFHVQKHSYLKFLWKNVHTIQSSTHIQLLTTCVENISFSYSLSSTRILKNKNFLIYGICTVAALEWTVAWHDLTSLSTKRLLSPTTICSPLFVFVVYLCQSCLSYSPPPMSV